MKRELKFKAWYPGHGYSEPFSVGLLPIWKVGESEKMLPYWEHQCHIVQYIGWKDIDGTEIYEGDIVQQTESLTLAGDRPLAVITYTDEDVASCGCCIDAFDGIGFVAKRPDGYRLIAPGLWRVVGNIHDNPELVK